MRKLGVYIILALISVIVIASLIYRQIGYKVCPNCTAQTYFQRGLEYACDKDRDHRLTALNFFEKAAEKGQFSARLLLAELYMKKLPEGYIRTFPKVEACLAGDVRPDRKRAISYFEQAIKEIEAGREVSQALCFNIYLLYAHDILSSGQSAKVARHWLERAANSGNYKAMLLLAQAFDSLGDYQQARKWFKKAWDTKKDWETALFLGDYYFYGKGMDIDYQRAEQWYQRALEEARKLASSSAHDEKIAEIQDACRVRLDIVRQRLAVKKYVRRSTLKYRLEGGLNENLVYVAGTGGKFELAGKVIRKDGDIIASLNDRIKYALQPKVMKKDGFGSMLEGVKWVLQTYAQHTSGKDEAVEFDFVLTR